MRTLVDAILEHGGNAGTITVENADGELTRTSWADVHDQALRMAAVLADDGVARGGRVGLLADTSVELVTALQAVWLAGAAVTVLPVPHRADTGVLGRIAADADLDLVLVGDRMPDAALPGRTRVSALSGLAALARTASRARPVAPDRDDLAVLQYTSGSTRSPRGVPVRHRHLAANLMAIRERLDHDAHHPETWLSWLPLYHDMGLIGFCALPMSCGCPLVLQSPQRFMRSPGTWLDRLARHRAAVTGAPNFAYAIAARLLASGPAVDLSGVRLAISGGEPVDAAVMAALARAGRAHGLAPSALTPAYGLAESTLAVAIPPPGGGVRTDRVDRRELEANGRAVPSSDPEQKTFVRVGPPVAGMRVRVIHRTTGSELGERRVGRIEVDGPSVVGGHWGRPRSARWLDTGDLGYLVDGDLVVCGRERDVLFAAGRNIYPQDVEAAATAVDHVRGGGAAAFGVPSDGGERLVVAVESAARERDGLRRAVEAAVLAEVGLMPLAVLVLRPGRLPKTTSGKLRRAELRSRYLAGDLIVEEAS